jgi:hypothetical protein
MRNIDDVLHFREDISPFLVHLTRGTTSEGGIPAYDALRQIITTMSLKPGRRLVSQARFGIWTMGLTDEQKSRYFSAICFTETPLNEVHCLLDIAYRDIHLSQYGLVFLKDTLLQRGVSPVLQFNNIGGDKNSLIQALCSLIGTSPSEAEAFLPLISTFGKKIQAPGTATPPEGNLDFRWEREWRYPYAKGPLIFDPNDIFIGLCPDDRISEFERLLPGVGFVDPVRNVKWYATKLLQARQRLDIKFSVL